MKFKIWTRDWRFLTAGAFFSVIFGLFLLQNVPVMKDSFAAIRKSKSLAQNIGTTFLTLDCALFSDFDVSCPLESGSVFFSNTSDLRRICIPESNSSDSGPDNGIYVARPNFRLDLASRQHEVHAYLVRWFRSRKISVYDEDGEDRLLKLLNSTEEDSQKQRENLLSTDNKDLSDNILHRVLTFERAMKIPVEQLLTGGATLRCRMFSIATIPAARKESANYFNEFKRAKIALSTQPSCYSTASSQAPVNPATTAQLLT
jgi:hypothetical protein